MYIKINADKFYTKIVNNIDDMITDFDTESGRKRLKQLSRLKDDGISSVYLEINEYENTFRGEQ